MDLSLKNKGLKKFVIKFNNKLAILHNYITQDSCIKGVCIMVTEQDVYEYQGRGGETYRFNQPINSEYQGKLDEMMRPGDDGMITLPLDFFAPENQFGIEITPDDLYGPDNSAPPESETFRYEGKSGQTYEFNQPINPRYQDDLDEMMKAGPDGIITVPLDFFGRDEFIRLDPSELHSSQTDPDGHDTVAAGAVDSTTALTERFANSDAWSGSESLEVIARNTPGTSFDPKTGFDVA